MKKNLFALLCAVVASCPVYGQESDIRTVDVKIITAKGKPCKDLDGYYYLTSDPAGLARIPVEGEMSLSIVGGDTLSLVLEQNILSVEIDEGTRSLSIVMKNARRLAGYTVNGGAELITEFDSAPLEGNARIVEAVTVADFSGYATLFDYLQGRVAGVEVHGNRISIRGRTTMHEEDNEPLIVVDGVPAESCAAANQSIITSDIQSVTIDKTGASYGARGKNGVIVVTMKKGGN